MLYQLCLVNGLSTPTRSSSCQNSSSSSTSSLANLVGKSSSTKSPRQTFNTAPEAAGTATVLLNPNLLRSASRIRSRRMPPPSASSSGADKISGLLTPTGSAGNSGTEGSDEEAHDHEERTRHGRAEEYNPTPLQKRRFD